MQNEVVGEIATLVARELNITTNTTLAKKIIRAHDESGADLETFRETVGEYGSFQPDFMDDIFTRISRCKSAPTPAQDTPHRSLLSSKVQPAQCIWVLSSCDLRKTRTIQTAPWRATCEEGRVDMLTPSY